MQKRLSLAGVSRMLLILIGIWIIWIIVVWSIQHRIMFPASMIDASRILTGAPSGVESIWLTDNGDRIESWFIPGKGVSAETPGPVVVFAHGNGELIDDNLDLTWLADLGTSVLLIEYRGYGRSTGSPSQRNLVSDTTRFVELLTQRPEVDPDRIGFMGRSIGCSVLAQVARSHPPNAMIMMVPPARLDSMAWRFGVPPFMVRSPFRTDLAVREFDSPLLLLPRDEDEIIPEGHAEIIDANASNSTIITLRGHHNWLDDSNEVKRQHKAIKAFLLSNGILKPDVDQP
ncbi:MAG: hypothetical protein CMJ40_08820 [Phycisphaerae bacterium]|nr:hypothetical protein [Phycisphaerae bacterium]